jgi:hypothetical protein
LTPIYDDNVKVTADDGGKKQRNKSHNCRFIYNLGGGKSHVTFQKGNMPKEEEMIRIKLPNKEIFGAYISRSCDLLK